MIDFKSLETFLWVVHLRSFNGAAQKLNTTQPAISQRINHLENDFGVRLLIRDNKTVTTTAAGQKLISYAERTISLRNEMLTALRNPKAVIGTLRLGVTETIVHLWLPELIKRVDECYPNLNLEIESDITWEMRTKLLNQELDLAFVIGPLNESLLKNRFLCNYPLSFLASPTLNLPKPSKIEDLIQHRIMTFPRRTQPYEILRTLLNEPKLPSARLHSSNALTTIVRLAIEGVVIAVIPPKIVEKEIQSGLLELIPTDISLPDVSFTATWSDSPDTLIAELVAELAIEVAKNSM